MLYGRVYAHLFHRSRHYFPAPSFLLFGRAKVGVLVSGEEHPFTMQRKSGMPEKM